MVVYNGGGILGWRVMGLRVAFTRSLRNDTEMIHGGCFMQYVIADAINCVPIPDNISFDKGSMYFVNPMTAIGLVEKI